MIPNGRTLPYRKERKMIKSIQFRNFPKKLQKGFMTETLTRTEFTTMN